jgi:hypothetical protein
MRRWRTHSFLLAALAVAAPACSAPAAPERLGVPRENFPYSFTRAPYIHPGIIQELTTDPSDQGDQVVAINLLDAQGSNRYFGGVDVRESDGEHPLVCASNGEDDFCYRYVGTTASGLHVLFTALRGGGSGVFTGLLFVSIENDKGLTSDSDEHALRPDRDRLLIKKHGETVLGDRWAGELKVDGNKIIVGEDQGWFRVSGGEGDRSDLRKARTLSVDEAPRQSDPADTHL